MVQNKFFKRKRSSITLKEIMDLTRSDISCGFDDIDTINIEHKILDVKPLSDGTKNDISFFTNAKYIEKFKNSKAGFCFSIEKYADKAPKTMVVLVNTNPHYAYSQVLKELYTIPLFDVNPEISEKAYIDKTANIGKNCEIQAGVYIGANVKIGDNCKVCANAVINHDSELGNECFVGGNATLSYVHIGDRAIIHNGAAIGQCGFGFAHNLGFNHKIPQIGTVKIGHDVEIGANTCIDRGAFDTTIIGDNCKIDNLVQIAHGVQLGKGCFLAGCAGIAGSAKLGNFVQVGGNTGITGHITIGDGSQIAGQSGVVKDLPPMSVVGGYPAIPLKTWQRMTLTLNQLTNNKKKK